MRCRVAFLMFSTTYGARTIPDADGADVATFHRHQPTAVCRLSIWRRGASDVFGQINAVCQGSLMIQKVQTHISARHRHGLRGGHGGTGGHHHPSRSPRRNGNGQRESNRRVVAQGQWVRKREPRSGVDRVERWPDVRGQYNRRTALLLAKRRGTGVGPDHRLIRLGLPGHENGPDHGARSQQSRRQLLRGGWHSCSPAATPDPPT